jgi:hypothetical protein
MLPVNKKHHKHSNNQLYRGGLASLFSKNEISSDQDHLNFNDNWSKESCDSFIVPIESFLDYQLKRERSSKRRCKEIVKLRNVVNEKNDMENSLKEFDMKINLNTLLKKSKDHSGSCPTAFIAPPHASNNYRALIAEEQVRKHAQCGRCLLNNKRYEENCFNELVNLSFEASSSIRKRKNRNNKIGLNNSKSSINSNGAGSTITKLPKLNVNRSFNFESFQNSINSIENSTNNGNHRKSVINKLPIEIQKRALV